MTRWTRKRKAVVIILGVLLLLFLLNLIANTVFITVEIIINEAASYNIGGLRTYTLYFNRLLVEAKVHRYADDNWFIRLFKLPLQFKVISKEDSNRVLELREVLRNTESELPLDFVRNFPFLIVNAKVVRHYIILTAGTPEALEINRILYAYLYGEAWWWREYKPYR